MSIQEDVNHRSISLTIRAAKLTGHTLWKIIRAFMRHIRNKQRYPNIPRGKQTVKQLAKQGQGVSTLDMGDDGIKHFDRVMRKFGVDYAVTKDKSTVPPTHTIFFKGRDGDAIMNAFKAYTAKITRANEKPSVLAQLQRMVERVRSNTLDKVKIKLKERSL